MSWVQESEQTTVEPVLSSHQREAKILAAEGCLMQGKYIGKCLFGIIPSGCLTQVAALNRWLLKQVRLYSQKLTLPKLPAIQ